MKELVSLILDYIPAFISTFVNAVAAPRAFARHYRVFEPAAFQRALTFFGVAVVVAVAAKTPLYPEQFNAAGFAAADAIWKFVLVCLLTLAIWLSFRVVGGQLRAVQYLVATLYFIGVLAVVTPVMVVSALFLARISELASLYYGLGCVLILVVWCVVAWLAYVETTGVSRARALAASVLMIFLVVIAIFPGLLVRGAFAPNQRHDLYGPFDPTQLLTQLLLMLLPV